MSVVFKHNFLSKNSELVLPPYEATEILLWALRAQIKPKKNNTNFEHASEVLSFEENFWVFLAAEFTKKRTKKPWFTYALSPTF